MQYTRNYNFTTGTTIVADQIDQEFDSVAGVVNGNIDTDNLADVSVTEEKIASNAVTTTKIEDAAVTNAKLDTTAGEIAGAWKTWTPTFELVGAASQNGTTWGKYRQVGKTVDFYASFTVIASSNFSGLTAVNIVLPVNAHADNASNFRELSCRFINSGVAWHPGQAIIISATQARLQATYSPQSTTAGFCDLREVTGSAPFGWGEGDRMFISGTYEAA